MFNRCIADQIIVIKVWKYTTHLCSLQEMSKRRITGQITVIKVMKYRTAHHRWAERPTCVAISVDMFLAEWVWW